MQAHNAHPRGALPTLKAKSCIRACQHASMPLVGALAVPYSHTQTSAPILRRNGSTCPVVRVVCGNAACQLRVSITPSCTPRQRLHGLERRTNTVAATCSFRARERGVLLDSSDTLPARLRCLLWNASSMATGGFPSARCSTGNSSTGNSSTAVSRTQTQWQPQWQPFWATSEQSQPCQTLQHARGAGTRR